MGFSWNLIAALGIAAFLISLASLEMSLTGMAVHSAYQDFAQPVQSYTLSARDFSFSSETETKTLYVSVADDAVYGYAYASLDGGAWKPVQLSGSAREDLWLGGSVTGQLSFTAADFRLSQSRPSTGRNFIVAYTCSMSGSSWDCHDGWQLWQFDARLAGT